MNLLVESINRVDCRLDQLKVFELLTLSGFSGILAVKAFGLEYCQSVEVLGKQAIVRECISDKRDFVVEITNCGAQPRSGNFTIGKDGFTIVPFQPFYWQSALINFNGEAYIARDGR